MKAVFAAVPEYVLDERRRTGADRWDEMWEGILHMPPAPNRDHQDFEFDFQSWLKQTWARPRGNRVHHQINLAMFGGWPDDYRIPDLLLLTPDRFHIDHNEYFEGPPTVAVEIHSPGDEAYEKLEFYADLRVPEVWIIHRDTRVLELFLLRGDEYERQVVPTDRWLASPSTGIEFRHVLPNKIAVRIAGDEATRADLPLD
jgi:Uma2 family endonuclease